jgi:TM2 domain-containing membrane protein YozV
LIGGDRFLRGQTSMGMLRLFLTISIIGTIASLIWILVELIIGAINYSKFEQDFLFNENGK